MFKARIGMLAAVLGVAVLGGCSHFHHDEPEYVPMEPAPAPIYVEPVAPKYN